jgi:hypothetical protein
MVSSDMHISRDDISYVLKGTFIDPYTGGVSTTALAAGDDSLLEIGPTITAYGPDIATVLDLTADETNWKLGRQLAVISSDVGGVEICFLRNLESLGGGLYRLRGLVRARYDTRRAAHAIGAKVFIFTLPDQSDVIFDPLITPNEDLYVKSQPSGSGGQVPLSNIAPEATVLAGKGVTPMAPEGLRATAPRHMVPAYMTGEDVTVEWNYQSTLAAGTGAGMQGYGNAHGNAAVDGAFEVLVTTTGDVTVQTTTQTTTVFTLTNAQIVALLGSEVSFKIKVRSTRGGYLSTQTSLTITKL